MDMKMELEKQRAFESFFGYIGYVLPDPSRGRDSSFDSGAEVLGLRFNEMQPAREFLRMANNQRSNIINFMDTIERMSYHMRIIDFLRMDGYADFHNEYFESLFDHINDLASYMRGELCSILNDKAYPDSFKDFCKDAYEMVMERSSYIFMWAGVDDPHLIKLVSNKNITGTFPHSFLRKLNTKDFVKKHPYYEIYKDAKKPFEMGIEDALVNGTLFKIEKKKLSQRASAYLNVSAKEVFGSFNVPKRLIQSKTSNNYGQIPQIDLLQIRAGRFTYTSPQYIIPMPPLGL